eukprot:TRINITY_DN45424_c0_g1_i1.p1 TRINITY_DN45424_c0_g1~~TRINITY_DN45424_c0_g1_i1.p1  ORF type:complete len:461 (-),score=91.02 TRINITY_DN45424_c0_g1_i1:95-1477(-)
MAPAVACSTKKGSEVYVELVPGRLAFLATPALAAARETWAREAHLFALGDAFVYEPFAADFGPLKLSMIYRYCVLLQRKLSNPEFAQTTIIHCCRADENTMANAACLICMYQVIVHGMSAEEAFEPFAQRGITFKPFRDASSRPTSFDLTILDCLRGVEKSIELGWFSFETFDVNTYECYDSHDDCGLNWLIPGKLMAFAGPGSTVIDEDGYRAYVPEDYVQLFHEANVGLVIRLNAPEYDRRVFIHNDIDHVDMIFPDGSCPAEHIISRFLDAVEAAPGAVAVHCKAGLGRTGTLIGIYAMAKYGFTAREFIGWSRVCRPGAVLGQQQQFLVALEAELLGKGGEGCKGLPCNNFASARDRGQGERLCGARKAGKAGGPSAERAATAVCANVDGHRAAALPSLLRSASPSQQAVKEVGHDVTGNQMNVHESYKQTPFVTPTGSLVGFPGLFEDLGAPFLV